MIRLLRDLTWLRWRLALNAMRSQRKRAGRSWSRWLEIATIALVVLVAIPIAAGLVAVAFVAGSTTDERLSGALLLLSRIGLLALMGMLVFAPLLRSAGRGLAGGMTRLQLLPVPPWVLHAASVASGLADPWLAVVVPALVLGLPLGLVLSGRPIAAAIALAAGLALVAFLLALGSVAAFVIQLLVRDRRRGERLVLVSMLVLTFAGMIPMLVLHRVETKRADEPRWIQVDAQAGRREVEIPAWLDATPPGLHAGAIEAAARGRPVAALLRVAVIGGCAAAALALSRWAHARLLSEPARSGGRRGAALARHRILPAWLESPRSAVAMAHARTIFRTVRGKLSVITPAAMVVVLALMQQRMGSVAPWPWRELRGTASSLFYLGLTLCFLNVTNILVNQFAIDRAGLSLLFLSPLSDLDLVRGKARGTAYLLVLAGAACLPAAIAMGARSSVMDFVAAILGLASVHLLASPLTATLAALLPKADDIGRTATGRPHAGASFIGSIATLVLLAAPPLISAAARMISPADWAKAIALAAWALVAFGVHVLGMRLAASVLGDRRERVALVAQGRAA